MWLNHAMTREKRAHVIFVTNSTNRWFFGGEQLISPVRAAHDAATDWRASCIGTRSIFSEGSRRLSSIRYSPGWHWTACAARCTYWRGTAICTDSLLRAAGSSRHVCCHLSSRAALLDIFETVCWGHFWQTSGDRGPVAMLAASVGVTPPNATVTERVTLDATPSRGVRMPFSWVAIARVFWVRPSLVREPSQQLTFSQRLRAHDRRCRDRSPTPWRCGQLSVPL